MKNLRGTIFLLLSALVWGMAFVAQSSAANTIGSFTFNATRSLLASVFLAVIVGIRKMVRKTSAEQSKEVTHKDTLFGGTMCGIMLFLAVNLQQFGIAAYPEEAAASGRAGFLTATYIIMIAVFSLFTGKKLSLTVLLSSLCCLLGMYLLCLSGGISNIYLGDLLVLASAVSFAFHILTVDRFSNLDSIKVSGIQFFVCGMLSLIAMFIFEKPNIDMLIAAWLPILYAGIFSSGIGYTFQIIGQKYAEPTVASIAMSLESVFAALAGWVILNERLNSNELIGCVLVFASVILAQVPDFTKKTN